jgi:PLP dependent protein
VAQLIEGIDPAVVRERLAAVRAEAGEGVQVLVACKYVADDDLPLLAEAGVTLVGENRAQDLERKQDAHGERFTWDFIGHLQSRKVRAVLPRVRWIHSVGSASAVAEVAKRAQDGTEVLLEVNVAREEGKSGLAPEALAEALEALAPARAVGLMTMPPLAAEPEDSRRWFAALAQLAADHGLRELSMGTTQDWRVAAQEGATVIRLGAGLLRPASNLLG